MKQDRKGRGPDNSSSFKVVRIRKRSRRAVKGSSGRTLKAVVKKGLKGLCKTMRTGRRVLTKGLGPAEEAQPEPADVPCCRGR